MIASIRHDDASDGLCSAAEGYTVDIVLIIVGWDPPQSRQDLPGPFCNGSRPGRHGMLSPAAIAIVVENDTPTIARPHHPSG